MQALAMASLKKDWLQVYMHLAGNKRQKLFHNLGTFMEIYKHPVGGRAMSYLDMPREYRARSTSWVSLSHASHAAIYHTSKAQ
jgi:hypothetical protein